MALTGEQRRVIREIIRAGKATGANRTQLLAALNTGAVESTFRNLAGGDGTSVGWRQETASSYPNVNRRDVYAGAIRFFNETKAKRDSLTPGALAQSAQRSAFPGRYAQHTKESAGLLRQFGAAAKPAAPKAAQAPQGASQTASSGSTDRKALLGDYLASRGNPDALINLAVSLRAADAQAQPAPVPTTPKAKPITRTPVPAGVPSGGAAKAVAAAASKVGVHEQGSNNVPFLGVRGQQWCGYFATWAARQGGAKVPSMGYVPDIAAAAAAKRSGFTGWTRGTRGARPGDLAVIRTSAGAHGHVGLVVSVNRDGSVNTIEGNWSDQVGRVRRKGEVTGIAHVAY